MSNKPTLAMFDVRSRSFHVNLVIDNMLVQTEVMVSPQEVYIEFTLVNSSDGEELCYIDATVADNKIEITKSEGNNVHIGLGIINEFEEHILNEIKFLSTGMHDVTGQKNV